MIKYNSNIIEDMDKIINEKNNNNKISNIFEIYNKINLNKNFNNNSINIKDEVKEEIIKENKNDLKGEINEEKELSITENKNTDNNKDVEQQNKKTYIRKNKELLIESEKKEDNNFMDFDITKMKELVDIKTKFKDIYNLFVLKDGKILVSGSQETSNYNSNCYLINIKNNCVFDINLYLDICVKNDKIQLDDDIVIIRDSSHKLHLVNIKENSYEIIDSFESWYGSQLFKLHNNNNIIVNCTETMINYYKYENKKLTLMKEKTIKFMKKLKASYYKVFLNENLVLVEHCEYGMFSNIPIYINSIFDIDKNKKIKSIKGYHYIGLINNGLLALSYEDKTYGGHYLCTFELNNLIKKDEFRIDSYISSFLTLNDNKYAVSSGDRIYMLEYNDHFEEIGYFKFDSKLKEIQTFPKSRFAVVYNYDTPFIHIYG